VPFGIWIEDIYVRPDKRRDGIGRAVMEQIAALARIRGLAELSGEAEAGA
jgi:GNAT superfamily N-acetyltransferase